MSDQRDAMHYALYSGSSVDPGFLLGGGGPPRIEGTYLTTTAQFVDEWNRLSPAKRDDLWADIADALEVRSKLFLRLLYVTTERPLPPEEQLERTMAKVLSRALARLDERAEQTWMTDSARLDSWTLHGVAEFCNQCSGPYLTANDPSNRWLEEGYGGHWDTCPNAVGPRRGWIS